MPDQCACGHEFTQSELSISEKSQVFALPKPQLFVIEYQIHKGKYQDYNAIPVIIRERMIYPKAFNAAGTSLTPVP